MQEKPLLTEKIPFTFYRVVWMQLKATEEDLREMSFGYRAKYIAAAAKAVSENGGEEWLQGLRKVAREDAKTALLSLTGVGPKVADCISLFSLDHLDVVPVDTHVWQMALKYMPGFTASATPNPKLHPQINQFFINKFGDKAGWAHTILFSSVVDKEETPAGPSTSKPAKAKKRARTVKDDSDSDFEDTASSAKRYKVE